MASVTLTGVIVGLGRRGQEVQALAGIDLEIGDGELMVVIGPSGSGKTTLLRVVAGLQRSTAGQVMFDGRDVTAVEPAGRDVAMVFQHPHLLPRRSVERNIAFPLEVRRRTIDEIRTRVTAEARALRIENLLARSPHELSLGERQLVQIARALVRVPTVLLLDEPLARLDPAQREWMRHELRLLQRGYGVTTMLTTNDPTEAMAMGDRMVVLDQGRVVQVGVPIDVYREPASLVAAELTGPLTVERVHATADHVGGEVVRGVRPDGSELFFDRVTGARLA